MSVAARERQEEITAFGSRSSGGWPRSGVSAGATRTCQELAGDGEDPEA